MRDFVATDSVSNGFGRSDTTIFRSKPGFTLMEETKAARPVRTSLRVPALEPSRSTANPAEMSGRAAALRQRICISINNLSTAIPGEQPRYGWGVSEQCILLQPTGVEQASY